MVGRFWVVVLVVGCGASPTPSGVDVGGAGKGGAGGGGSPASMSGGTAGTASGNGGAGGVSGNAGGVGTNGGLGVAWPDEDFGPVLPGTACEPDFSILEGKLEGQSFSNAYRNTWPQLTTFSSWWYSWLAPHGNTQIFTKAPQPAGFSDPRRDLVPAQAYPVGGWFSLGSEGPSPNTLYCLGEGSTFTPGEKVDGKQPIEMALALSKLGSCPGTPVSGNLTFCYGPNQDATCPKGVTGELAGEPITTTIQGIAGMGAFDSDAEDVSTFLFGERWVRLRFPKAGGALESGLLLDAADTFELTDTYCLDAGTVTSFGSSSYKIDITSISKLGACGASAAVGTARACTETFR